MSLSQEQKDLLDAIVKNDITGIRSLIKNGLNVNFINQDGQDLATVIEQKIDLEIHKILSNAATEVNLSHANLITTTFNDNIRMLTILLDAGLVYESRYQECLFGLVWGAQVTELTVLLANKQKNIDLNKKLNDQNHTASHVAADGCCSEGGLLLIAAGADFNVIDNEGKTPLHIAVENSRVYQFIQALIAYGANVNAVTHNHETPLSLAIKSNNQEAQELLKIHGAKA